MAHTYIFSNVRLLWVGARAVWYGSHAICIISRARVVCVVQAWGVVDVYDPQDTELICIVEAKASHPSAKPFCLWLPARPCRRFLPIIGRTGRNQGGSPFHRPTSMSFHRVFTFSARLFPRSKGTFGRAK